MPVLLVGAAFAIKHNGGSDSTVSEDITCWDGDAVATAADCRLPEGRAGLGTVFPNLDAACREVDPQVTGKAEVFECEFDTYLIRYSRWVVGFDKYGYYDRTAGIGGREWVVNDTFAGRQWANQETGAGRPFRWSAAFRYSPYSVSVEAATRQDRADGIAAATVRPPEEIGSK